MCDKSAIGQVATMLKGCIKEHGLDCLEFELRLGRAMHLRGGRGFSAHVGRSTFNRIQAKLDKSKAWGSVEKSHTTDYFTKTSDVRVSYDHDTCYYTCMTKKKVTHTDIECPSAATDIRCSVALEKVFSVGRTQPEYDWLFSREKMRTRYHYRHFAFDLTQVQRHTSHHEDSDEDEVYEIEVELTKPQVLQEMSVTYIVEHALLLCSDIIAMAN